MDDTLRNYLNRTTSLARLPPPPTALVTGKLVKSEKKAKKKKKKKQGQNPLKSPSALKDSLAFQRKLVRYLFDLKKSKVPSEKLQSLLLMDADLKSVPVSKKDIPFDLSSFFKGTQNPTFRLYIIPVSIDFAAATAYTTVFVVEGASLGNFTDFAAIFDEYRVVIGKVELIDGMGVVKLPATANVTCEQARHVGLAVIDYDDSTALASYAAGMLYDTKQLWYPVGVTTSGNDHTGRLRSWDLKFEKLPDQEWIDSGTGTTDFAYWKPYVAGLVMGPTISGAALLTGWVDVQFRAEH